MATIATDWLPVIPGLESRITGAHDSPRGIVCDVAYRITDADLLRDALLKLRTAGTLTGAGQRLLDEVSIAT